MKHLCVGSVPDPMVRQDGAYVHAAALAHKPLG